MPSDRAKVSALIRKEDAARTATEWIKLDTTSLRLKCNEYNVEATGKKDALVGRLMEYFSTHAAQTTSEHESEESETEESLDLTIDDNVDTIAANNGDPTSSKRKQKKDGGPSSDKKRRSSNTKRKDGPRKNQDGGKVAQQKHSSTNIFPPKSPSLGDTSRHDDNYGNIDAKMDQLLTSMQATQTDLQNMQNKQSALEHQVQNIATATQTKPPHAFSSSASAPAKKGKFVDVPLQQIQQQQLQQPLLLPEQQPPPLDLPTPSSSSQINVNVTHTATATNHQVLTPQASLLPGPSVVSSVQGGCNTGTVYSAPNMAISNDPWASFQTLSCLRPSKRLS